MAWGSTVPAALVALVQRLQTTPELEGVKVYDGPQIDGSAPMESITVGLSGDEDALAAEGQDAREGLAADRSRETYTIHCLIEVSNARGDHIAARGRAFELVNAVGGMLAINPLLDGVATSAQLGSWSLLQGQSGGALVTIQLGIDIEAFTSR